MGLEDELQQFAIYKLCKLTELQISKRAKVKQSAHAEKQDEKLQETINRYTDYFFLANQVSWNNL